MKHFFPWWSSSATHKLLLSGLPGLSLLGLSALPAHAGQWSFSELGIGSKSPYTAPDTQNWVLPKPDGWPDFIPWPGTETQKTASATLVGPNYEAKSATTSGTIKIVCKWTPSYNGEPLPSFAGFLVTSKAFAAVDYGTGHAPSASATVSNGFGSETQTDTHTTLFNPAGETKEWSSVGKRLFTVSPEAGTVGTNGSVTWELPVAVSSQITASGESASIRVNVLASAVTDTRAVILSRSNAIDERTEYESGIPVTYGDTTFSYLSQLGDNIEYHANVPEFAATFTGGWSNGVIDPDVTWNWVSGDGLNVPDTGYWRSKTGSRWKVDYGDLRKYLSFDIDNVMRTDWGGTPHAPKTVTLKYFARDDADGAEAESRYVLTAHDPIEIYSTIDTSVSYETVVLDGNGGPLIVSGPGVTGPYNTIGNSTSDGFLLTATVPDISIFENVFHFGATYTHSKTHSINQTTTNNGTTLISGQYCYVVINHVYNRHHSYFWKYNPEGRDKRYIGAPNPLNEVPHEAIADNWYADEVRWSAPTPTTDPAADTALPTPSYTYS